MIFCFIYCVYLPINFVVKMNFNNDGILDPGKHKMTWKEFYGFFSFSERRKELLEGLGKVVNILREIGVTRIYIDGSFVTNKLEPDDWDACFESSVPVSNNLKYPFKNGKAQKKLYKGHVFDAQWEADEFGTKYLEYFQQMKENSAIKKGIVELIK